MGEGRTEGLKALVPPSGWRIVSYSLHHVEFHHIRAIIRAHNTKRCRE
jgi:hypothetical protein